MSGIQSLAPGIDVARVEVEWVVSGRRDRRSAVDVAEIPFESTDRVREPESWKHKKNYEGFYWSATIGRHVWFESLYERAALMRFDRDRRVLAIAAQSMMIHWSVGARWHVPDFFVHHRSARQEVPALPRERSRRRSTPFTPENVRTRRIARVGAALLGVLLMSGCGSTGTLPQIEVEGTRPYLYTDLEQLAEKSNAIVVASPTGKSDSVPLPEDYGPVGAAPTVYIEMRVDRVVAGKVSDNVIRVVTNGDDARTGEPALMGDGPFLLFLAPAMYGPDDPAGGYVVTGGPTGMYAPGDSEGTFVRVDEEAAKLPERIDSAKAETLPQITKSEETLIAEGP